MEQQRIQESTNEEEETEMSKVPCKDCPEREVGCHGRCEKYKEYKENREKECIWLISKNQTSRPSMCKYKKSTGRYEAPVRRLCR